jgi:hypothetical protein
MWFANINECIRDLALIENQGRGHRPQSPSEMPVIGNLPKPRFVLHASCKTPFAVLAPGRPRRACAF